MYPGKHLHLPAKHSPLPEHLLGQEHASPHSTEKLASGASARTAFVLNAAAPCRKKRSADNLTIPLDLFWEVVPKVCVDKSGSEYSHQREAP